ncbi:MAG: hypothetical protein A2V85_11290 [Chloroflexi bacterium RBG_16_72_14]|nr:MAG: hypothetical protein A2V85_11290 [Chloroflexi bacterium RBG_16_72_14]
MVDVIHAHPRQPDARPSIARSLPLSVGRAVLELREVAHDLVGRPEHDELSADERARLELEIREAVGAVMAHPASAPTGAATIAQRLTAELSPRVEALPVHLRVALANARRRALLGVD